MNPKVTLNWSDFEANATRAFGLIRDDDFLQDVTLVGEDDSQIAAHKLVLSACSEYFKNIFKKNKNTPLFLCLEGVNSSEIMNLLDFIYIGEIKKYFKMIWKVFSRSPNDLSLRVCLMKMWIIPLILLQMRSLHNPL